MLLIVLFLSAGGSLKLSFPLLDFQLLIHSTRPTPVYGLRGVPECEQPVQYNIVV